MPKQSKGMATRQRILEEVSQLYNEEGLTLTLDQLARKLGLTKGRITNYFPKKEQLLLAIFREYEDKAAQLYQRYQQDEASLDLSDFLLYYSKMMDLQYRYRFAMAYLAVQPIGEPELQQHIATRYRQNKANLKKRLSYQVRSGTLREELLEPETFELFSFQIYNLFTTWVVSLQLYYKDEGYEQMKPVFLRGIISCYTPYLTEKGKAELEEAFRQLLGEQPG